MFRSLYSSVCGVVPLRRVKTMPRPAAAEKAAAEKAAAEAAATTAAGNTFTQEDLNRILSRKTAASTTKCNSRSRPKSCRRC